MEVLSIRDHTILRNGHSVCSWLTWRLGREEGTYEEIQAWIRSNVKEMTRIPVFTFKTLEGPDVKNRVRKVVKREDNG